MEVTLKYRAGIVAKAIEPFMWREGMSVLDIGCGNGVISHEIRDRFKCSLMGADILEYLKRDIPFKKMSGGAELLFADKEFDTGLLIDVLHHIPFEKQLLLVREALRVCREVLVFEVKPTLLAKVVDILANLVHNSRMPMPLTHRTIDQWVELFGKEGIACEVFPVARGVLWASSNFLIRIKVRSSFPAVSAV